MALDDHHKHFVGSIAQKALIEHDGKILLVQYPTTDAFVGGKWDLPGGRLHEGESTVEGLTREVLEETTAVIEVLDILATGVHRVNDTFQLFWVIYRAELTNPLQTFTPEEGEIGAVHWVEKKDFFGLPMSFPGYQEALKTILV